MSGDRAPGRPPGSGRPAAASPPAAPPPLIPTGPLPSATPTGATAAAPTAATTPGRGGQPDAAPPPDTGTRRSPSTRGSGRRFSRLRLTIGVKLTLVMGALVAVLVVSSLLLLAQGRSSAQAYDRLLDHQVAQGLQARQMQVEFKKQVQEWKDVLLRGSNPSDLTDYLGRFRAQDLRVNQLNAGLIASATDPAVRDQLSRFRDAHRQLDAQYAAALVPFEASHGADIKAADSRVRGLDRPPTDLLDGVVSRLETQVADEAARQRSETDNRNRATIVTGSGLLLVLVGLLALAVMNILRPVRRLTRDARLVASQRLPGAIRTIKALDPREDAPVLPPFRTGTNDELRDLGDALTSLQDSALQLAVEQHRTDRETADMLVNLGRRNQNLIGRLLGYVTELERHEQDPEVLSQLFRLDHATTRIRRNAESMLVLAGASQTRTWSRPVPVIDVVRAALSEVEEYVRVDLHHVEDEKVHGAAVADVVHLVAELVENATNFSPPTTQVTVIGQRVRDGYRLRIVDQGVGMTRRELDQANRRINRVESGWGDTKLLGLYVVGRLARRRGIDVVLEPSAGQGITASILLPESILGGRAGSIADLRGAPSGPSGPGTGGTAGARGADVTGGLVVDLTEQRADAAPPSAPAAPAAVPASPAAVPAQWPREQGEVPSGPYGAAGTPRSPYAVPDPSTAGPAAFRAPVPAAASPVPADEGATAAAAAVPRRVRGAQLPDLGPAAEPVVARPEVGPGAPDSLRWQLRSFQLDVQAARRSIEESSRPAAPATRHDHAENDPRRPEGEG